MGPVSPLPEPTGWAALECDPMRPVSHVSLGNPHSVVGVEEVAIVDLKRLGELVPHVNLEIIEQGPGINAITMRVHERGSGETRSCGTGACAVAVATAVADGRTAGEEVTYRVDLPGGTLTITWTADDEGLMTGPAVLVARGETDL